MALLDNAHYVDSVGYAAVTAWATGASISAGALRRQNATPSVGNERVFVALDAGTTHATTEPTWPTTRGGKVTDNSAIVWQECTGLAGVNGDATNTPTWDEYRAIGASGTLGQLIKNNAGTHYFILSTAGTLSGIGSQPTFNTTTGADTTDNGATWTCIGAVGNFTGNQAPHARLANALTTNWGAAGNDIFIKSSHAWSQSTAISLTGASVAAASQRWLCHNGGAYPPAEANLTTGASETSTASNVSVLGVAIYVEGVTFSASGNGAAVNVGANGAKQKFKNCVFARSGTTGSLIFGNTASGIMPVIELEDCQLSFGNVGNNISVGQCDFIMRGGSLAGVAVPTSLIGLGASPSHCNVLFSGVDLSAAGSGKTLVAALNTMAGTLKFVNCKVDAAVTRAATPSTPNYRVEFINCDDGAVNYRNEIYDYHGTLTTETTIVRSGGASDGVTPVAHKIVTTGNINVTRPFECFPITLWNDDVGSSKALTIEGIWDDGAVPNNDEIWVEVEYLGASGNPKSSFVSDRKATVLTTAAGQGAGSGTWGGSTTKFKLDVSFTPQMKGPITARVKAAKASSTFYVDPKPVLS